MTVLTVEQINADVAEASKNWGKKRPYKDTGDNRSWKMMLAHAERAGLSHMSVADLGTVLFKDSVPQTGWLTSNEALAWLYEHYPQHKNTFSDKELRVLAMALKLISQPGRHDDEDVVNVDDQEYERPELNILEDIANKLNIDLYDEIPAE